VESVPTGLHHEPAFRFFLDDWLKEQGIYEEVTTHAIKRVLLGRTLKFELA
jgi:hypothetical protein